MKAILASTPKGGIGYKNSLPWPRLQGDLARFKALTLEQYVIMGRNTWDSLPKKPLPDRESIVVTSRPLFQPSDPYDLNAVHRQELLFNLFHNRCLAIKSIEPFVDYDNAWIIGGAQLLNSSWPWIKEFHLSRTHKEYECDTFIDLNYIEQNFVQISKEVCADHDYEIWQRK